MNGSYWTAEGEQYMREHYATMPLPELVAHLGRPRKAICAKAARMGLKQSVKPERRGRRTTTRRLVIAALAASERPAGETFATLLESTGMGRRILSTTLNNMRRKGIAFIVGPRGAQHYFATAEKRDAGRDAVAEEMVQVEADRLCRARALDRERCRQRRIAKIALRPPKPAKPAKTPKAAKKESVVRGLVRQPALNANVVIKKRREELPVTYAPDCKHTVCPCGKDTRYSVPAGFVGEFTQQWRELRSPNNVSSTA